MRNLRVGWGGFLVDLKLSSESLRTIVFGLLLQRKNNEKQKMLVQSVEER